MKNKLTEESGLIAFHTLHAVYHERDFRVRVNDPTISFVRRSLAEAVGHIEVKAVGNLTNDCPACAAGFKHDERQPKKEDR